jgi:hypothetical protein
LKESNYKIAKKRREENTLKKLKPGGFICKAFLVALNTWRKKKIEEVKKEVNYESDEENEKWRQLGSKNIKRRGFPKNQKVIDNNTIVNLPITFVISLLKTCECPYKCSSFNNELKFCTKNSLNINFYLKCKNCKKYFVKSTIFGNENHLGFNSAEISIVLKNTFFGIKYSQYRALHYPAMNKIQYKKILNIVLNRAILINERQMEAYKKIVIESDEKSLFAIDGSWAIRRNSPLFKLIVMTKIGDEWKITYVITVQK